MSVSSWPAIIVQVVQVAVRIFQYRYLSLEEATVVCFDELKFDGRSLVDQLYTFPNKRETKKYCNSPGPPAKKE